MRMINKFESMPEKGLGPCRCGVWHKKEKLNDVFMFGGFFAMVWISDYSPMEIKIKVDSSNEDHQMVNQWLMDLKKKKRMVLPLRVESLYNDEPEGKRGRKKRYTKLRFYSVWVKKKKGDFLILSTEKNKEGQYFYMK